jgi:hypothetical protein
MDCKDLNDKIILYLYDELSESEKKELNVHVKSCPSCLRVVQEHKQLFQLLSQGELSPTSPRWGIYWGNILEGVTASKSAPWFSLPAFKWAITFAGFVFFMVMGFFIGRGFLIDTRTEGDARFLKGHPSFQMVLGNYLEDLKPLMLDLTNASFSDQADEPIFIEDGIIKSMLIRTRLLRKRYSDRNDSHLEDFLQDIEWILMEIDNRAPGDRKEMNSIQKRIEDKEIPFKLHLFKYKSETV